MHRIVAVVIATGLLVGGAACGGDDDGGDRLSKAEFTKQANAICKKGDAKINAAEDSTFTGGEPKPEQVDAFLKDTLIPTVTEIIDGIEALNPPKEMEAGVDDMIDAAQDALERVEEAADSDDPTALFASDPFEKADAAAKKLGLDDCADEDG